MTTRNQKLIHATLNNIHNLIFRNNSTIDDNALTLDSSWSVTENSKALVIEFFEKEFLPWYLTPGERLLKSDDKLNQLYSFLANLTLAFPMRPLRLPLDRNKYRKIPLFSTFIIDFVNFLNAQRLIFIRRGYSPENGPVGQQTRICPKNLFRSEFLSKLEIFKKNDTTSNKAVIILRDKHKNDIVFQETQETQNLRDRINKINDVNGRHDVMFSFQSHIGIASTELHAVYNNGTFSQNGRLYTGCLGYQSLPKNIRKTILIDGNKTIERDYSGHHPRILYALNGTNYVGSPYENIIPNSDNEMIKILKIVVLVLINSSNHKETVKGCFGEFSKTNWIFPYLEETGLKILDLINACKDAHKSIEKYFASNQGMQCSNIDSKIALQVVEHFTSQGKVCLPVHDSFIVRTDDDKELISIMENAYRTVIQKVTNSSTEFSCVVK